MFEPERYVSKRIAIVSKAQAVHLRALVIIVHKTIESRRLPDNRRLTFTPLVRDSFAKTVNYELSNGEFGWEASTRYILCGSNAQQAAKQLLFIIKQYRGGSRHQRQLRRGIFVTKTSMPKLGCTITVCNVDYSVS